MGATRVVAMIAVADVAMIAIWIAVAQDVEATVIAAVVSAVATVAYTGVTWMLVNEQREDRHERDRDAERAREEARAERRRVALDETRRLLYMCDVQAVSQAPYLSPEMVATVQNSLSHHLHGEQSLSQLQLGELFRYLRYPNGDARRNDYVKHHVRSAVDAICVALGEPLPQWDS